MADPFIADRVKETTTTTGTGTLNLDGAVTNFRTFVAAIGSGKTCYYCIEDTTNNAWEVGIGTITSGSPDTLSRTTILASSNAGAAVNLAAGTKNVFCTASAPLLQREMVLLREEQSSGTNGGTFTSGAWRTRTLNTEVVDSHDVCSLVSNQFTLSAGTYEILAFAPANSVVQHQAKLRNTTNSTDILFGTSGQATTTGFINTHSIIQGRFTIAASKALEIQHQCNTTQATNGFGVAGSFGTEVYTTVMLWKVD